QYPYIAGERGGDISIGKPDPDRQVDAKTGNRVATETTALPTLAQQPAIASSGWKKAVAIIGALAIGAVMMSQSSSSNDQPDAGVRLIIPTP
ncbi:MAG: hypothetical protein AAF404_04835, partial [Pseudomonadota bacterium]